MSPETLLQDLRRDGSTIVGEQQAREIADLRFEDIAEEDEITFLFDRADEEQWEGFYQYDGNAEKIYQVAYRFETQQFFITDFVMLSCTKADSPFIN